MSEIEAIQPIYLCEESQPILLYEGEMELDENGQITLGIGKIEFTWIPRIRNKFSIHSDRGKTVGFSKIPNDDVLLRFKMTEICTEKLIAKVHILKTSSQNATTVCDGDLLNFELGNGDELSYSKF